jgi:hypothetical protein
MADEEARNLERFREILSKYPDVLCDADLASGDRGRGLFATSAVRAGEPVVRVPLKRCIFNQIDLKQLLEGTEYTLPLSEKEKSRISWNSEITLTGKLMEVLEQSAFDGTGFWAEYWWLLPNPNTKEIPCNLPRAALEEIMTVDPSLAKLVLTHRANVRAAWAQKTDNQSGIPPALFWSNSMVLSRCFHLWAHADETRLPDTMKGGMIPFIDLINHDNDPNCTLVEGAGTICCVARRDIGIGEELTHPYTQDASNQALFSRFGFVIRGNPADRVPWPDHIPRFPRIAIEPMLSGQHSERAVESVSRDTEESDASEVEEELLLVMYFEVRIRILLALSVCRCSFATCRF